MSPDNNNNDVVLFGETDFRNRRVPFGIKMDDRRRHMYIIGKSGVGKSELLKVMAIQDIQSGRGLAFIDPHGDPVEDLLDYIPEERMKDVIYINPADMEFPIAFNVMEQVDPDKRHLVADGVMGVFKKIWVDVWSPRMEYILNNAILALLEVPGSTVLGINRMFAEKDFRNQVVSQINDPVVKAFWTQEYAKYTDKFASEATAAIQNKVGQFIASSLIRNIIGQPKSSFDVRQLMDEGKILLVNVSKGRIGEDNSRLLGAMLITKIQLAAMSRIDIHQSERRDFALYVDEFQNFATASFATILSEARKFKLSLIMGHQYVAQLDEAVRDAVFGNVGTIISFRVGAEDAELLEKELAPEFMATDIVNLGKRQIYVKLLIDGLASRAFSARTLDTPPPPAHAERSKVIEFSREAYAGVRSEVERSIAEWHAPVTPQFSAEPRAPQMRQNYGNASFSDNGPRPAPRTARPSAPAPVRPSTSTPPASRPRPSAPASSISLSEALKQGPVDFRGRKLQSQPAPSRREPEPSPKPKVNVDLKGLRSILEDSLKKEEE